MKDRLHIIFAEEEGKVRSFTVSKSRIKKSLFLISLTFIFLIGASGLGMQSLVENHALRSNLASMQDEMVQLASEKNEFKTKVVQLKQKMHLKVCQLEEEKEALIEGPVNTLYEKNRLIDQVLSQVGFNLKKNSDEDMGGPYIPVAEDSPEAVLFKTDKIIETLKEIPLGYPAHGRVTSGFGVRHDPYSKKLAFHEGIDIKNSRGTKIFATADGTVSKSGYNSSYGKYLVIDHDSGFSTKYAHLKRVLAPKGKTIKRGDVVGLLGNTGRSTGAHLHYEILYKGKPFDPAKFINIAEIIENSNTQN